MVNSILIDNCIKCKQLYIYNKIMFNKYVNINRALNLWGVLNVFWGVLRCKVCYAIYHPSEILK